MYNLQGRADHQRERLREAPPPVAQYLATGEVPVFATLHPAPAGPVHDTAVLLCPPFGWDEVCSYRSFRAWAEDLAASGYPALRISYPSTGDSGGEVTDPGRLAAWVGAVECAAGRLREASGARRLAAVGMGLGGLLAYLAAAGGAPLDDLVLWGTPARGRSIVRQLRAFAKLEVAMFFEGLPEPGSAPPGELEAGGFRLSAETVSELSAVELCQLPLPEPSRCRILLLERDGIAPDLELIAQLEHSGASVTSGPGRGYGAMTSHPQTARPARAVFEAVRTWLEGAPGAQGPVPTTGLDNGSPLPSLLGSPALTKAEIATPHGSVRETPITIPGPGGELSAILVEPSHEPPAGLAVVLLNAGAVRRIGPNRMWVEAARRWASRGVPVLRLDVAGIGDSNGDAHGYEDDEGLYVPDLVPQVLAALDQLERSGVADRFVLGGLCAGAYWAFHAALEDDRVTGTLMINPRVLVWDSGLGAARDLRALVDQPFSLARLRRAATPQRLRAVLRWLLASPRRMLRRLGPAGRIQPRTDAVLERFISSGKRGLLLFSEREPLEAELLASGHIDRLRAYPEATIERIAVRDHTLRPIWAQGRAHEALDRALERELATVLSE